MSKSEYTFRTINSLINSLNFNKDLLQKIKIKITVIDHNSKNQDLLFIKNKLEKSNLNFEIINLDMSEFNHIKVINKNNPQIENNMKSTMASIFKSFQVAKDSSFDLFYFVDSFSNILFIFIPRSFL